MCRFQYHYIKSLCTNFRKQNFEKRTCLPLRKTFLRYGCTWAHLSLSTYFISYKKDREYQLQKGDVENIRISILWAIIFRLKITNTTYLHIPGQYIWAISLKIIERPSQQDQIFPYRIYYEKKIQIYTHTFDSTYRSLLI